MSETEAKTVACLTTESDPTLDLVQFPPFHELLDVAVHSVDYRVPLTRYDGLPGSYDVIAASLWIICFRVN